MYIYWFVEVFGFVQLLISEAEFDDYHAQLFYQPIS